MRREHSFCRSFDCIFRTYLFPALSLILVNLLSLPTLFYTPKLEPNPLKLKAISSNDCAFFRLFQKVLNVAYKM